MSLACVKMVLPSDMHKGVDVARAFSVATEVYPRHHVQVDFLSDPVSVCSSITHIHGQIQKPGG
jgi:hypothetical protein